MPDAVIQINVMQGAAYYAIECDYFFVSLDTILRCNKLEEMKAF